jgi:predicted phosphoribosyltransferase
MLAERLRPYADEDNLLVLGLPRGGVPVAFEIARTLGAPLDVFVVRKLGLPGQEELAMGAIASGGVRVLNDEVIQSLGIDEEAIARATAAESAALERRERIYRGERGPIEVGGRTVILVDDGIATGATMRAATRAAGSQNPERLVVAVPVAAQETCEEFRSEADEVVCAVTPESVPAVSRWYEDFTPTADEEVGELLARSEAALPR